MLHEIRVEKFGEDPNAEELKHNANRMLGIENLDVTITSVYRLEGDEPRVGQVVGSQVHDPITEHVRYGERQDWDNPARVEVAPQPGAMVPAEGDLTRVARLHGFDPTAVRVSEEYEFGAGVSSQQREAVVKGLLFNPVIQQIVTEQPTTLIESRQAKGVRTVATSRMTPTELLELSGERGLALNESEMTAIQSKLKDIGREPTDCELEGFGGWWSDHCRHKTWASDIELPNGTVIPSMKKRVWQTSAKHFDKTGVRTAFKDNSGGIDFYDGHVLTIKGETHISPSGEEPFAGAGTGVGGLERDMRATGFAHVRQIGGGDILVFPNPKADKTKLPKGMLAPDWIMKRVIDGIADYGNKTGIPTVQGSIHWLHDKDSFQFDAKPCVLVTGVGITSEAGAEKRPPNVGDRLLLVGGRTGRDGIHGANASSVSASSVKDKAFGSFVQNGNPIEQKKMFDYTDELARRGLYTAANDLGASGIASGAVEMGEGVGLSIQLADVPVKYPGLEAWEKFISESQERCVLAVPPEHMQLVQELAEQFEVEATDIGFFDGTNRLTVHDGEELAVDLDYEFIMDGMPDRVLKADWQPPQIDEVTPEILDYSKTLVEILMHGAVASKEPVTRQYDQSVQGGNMMPSYGGVHRDAPNDAAIMKPLAGKPYGVVLSSGINPNLIAIDPYWGTIWSCVESMANNVAVGGDPEAAAFNENFIWPSPTEKNVGSQSMAVDAVCDFMDTFERSVISGKDSQSSTYRNNETGTVIENNPLVGWSTLSKIPDIRNTVSSDFKKVGSRLVMVGRRDLEAMGGSVLYDVANGQSARIPRVDLASLPKTMKTVHAAIKEGFVRASHDISEGGVAVTLAEMCFGGDCGVTIDFDTKGSAEQVLFNETPGCFILEVDERADVAQLFEGVPHQVIGTTTAEKTLNLQNGGVQLINGDVTALKQAWKRPMQEFYA